MSFMKRVIVLGVIATLITSLVASTGCAANNSTAYDFTNGNAETKDKTTYNFIFSNGSVEIKDKTVAIKLNGNPTTGYEWQSSVPGDSIKELSSKYVSDETDEPTCGGGGVYTFTYEGVKGGSTVVTLTYGRPWENNIDRDILKLTIETDDAGNVLGTSVANQDKLLNASKGDAVATVDGFDCIEYTIFGTAATGDKYVAQRTDTGVQLAHYVTSQSDDANDTLLESYNCGYSTYMLLVQAIKQNSVRNWDGFSGSNATVLDGYSFSFKATFVDGQTVSAGGTNAYPQGYRTFIDTFTSAFTAEA